MTVSQVEFIVAHLPHRCDACDDPSTFDLVLNDFSSYSVFPWVLLAFF